MKFWNIDAIRHNINRDRGFTIIECIVALAVLAILSSVIVRSFAHYNIKYGGYCSLQVEESNVSEAFMMLQSRLDSGNDEIILNNNSIKFCFSAVTSTSKDDYIYYLYLAKGTLYFKLFNNGYEDRNPRELLRNAQSISVENDNKNIFIKIVMETGNEYLKCLNANHQTVIEDS